MIVIKLDNGEIVASGDDFEDALNNLIEAINADDVDTENHFLSLNEE